MALSSLMKRTLALTLALAGLAAAVVFGYNVVSRDREYRQHIRRGEAAAAIGQTFQAIEAFSGALVLKPDSMLAHLKRGETYRRRGDLVVALRDLRAASRLDPTATRPWEALGDVNYTLERDRRAVEAYESYIRLDDRSARVLYKLGLAHHRAGNLDHSIAALRRALAVDDRFAEAYYALGLCLAARGQRAEAIAAFQRAVALQPGFAPPREELADLYGTLGRRQEEVQQLEALAALDPGRPERHVALGLGYARSGHADMAILALGRADERLPDQPGVHAALARVWLRAAEERGDEAALQKALEVLEPMATRRAVSGDALALYGRALLMADEVRRAEQVLQQAASKLPVEIETFQYLAAAGERLGHLDLARRALVQHDTLSGDERHRAARAARIGELSMRLHDLAGAVRWYERAVRAAPLDLSLAQELAQARQRLSGAKPDANLSSPAGSQPEGAPTDSSGTRPR